MTPESDDENPFAEFLEAYEAGPSQQTSEAQDSAETDEFHPIVDIPRAELLQAIQHDCVTFFSFYLQDELTMRIPALHEEIWDEILEMVETLNQRKLNTRLLKLFGVPREHAKSTISKLAAILLLRYSPLSFLLYVSKTNSAAANAIRDIRLWLDCDQEKSLYGPVRQIKSSETDSIWILEIVVGVTATNPGYYKRIILKAAGAQQHVRGLLVMNRRPQIIIIDDIEDQDNTSTAEAQAKLDEWLFGTLLKAFDSRNYICIFIGNMLRSTTLLARLSKEPAWNPTVFGAIVKNATTGEIESLWPEKNPLELLLEEYAQYRRMGLGHIWEAEMMNLTQDEIFKIDLGEMLRIVQPTPEGLEAGFIMLDPAFGQKNWHDESGITVHARVKGCPVPAIIEGDRGRWLDPQLYERLMEISYRWGITVWAIEAVAAQGLLISLFKTYMQLNGIPENFIAMIPIPGKQTAKPSRIQAFKSTLANGSYAISEGASMVADALISWTPASTDHDDIQDSAAMGALVWNAHESSIKQRGILQDRFRIEDGVIVAAQTGIDACAL